MARRLDLDFGAGGGTLSLLDPTAFDALGSGHIAGFAAGDTISLAGDWAFHTLTNPTSGTTLLTLTSGDQNHRFDFIGVFSQSDFTIASGTTAGMNPISPSSAARLPSSIASRMRLRRSS
jgi:hypothetical protein